MADGRHAILLDAQRTAVGDLAAGSPRHHVPADLPREIQDVGAAPLSGHGAWSGSHHCHV